jgi:tetratricopeptide (TPR) repeat protein
VTREAEKTVQVSDLWRQTYPRDARPVRELAFAFGYLGEHERALEAARQALAMGPGSEIYFRVLAMEYASLNRFSEAEAAYAEAERRGLHSEGLSRGRYQLAFLKDDAQGMASEVAAASGKPGRQDLLLAAQAETEAWHGRLGRARELTERASSDAARNDARERAATYVAAAALREVELGSAERARVQSRQALELARNRDVRYLAAVALARAGDSKISQALAADLETMFPLDTLVQRYWLPTIRAALALQRNDAV